ncbi:hypothetical protein BDD12DRAFT_538676 [Trichophaea hybrida]|nr:hypothetical protein BDD12DRAFT_538676 [Trichophaea hybrida]
MRGTTCPLILCSAAAGVRSLGRWSGKRRGWTTQKPEMLAHAADTAHVDISYISCHHIIRFHPSNSSKRRNFFFLSLSLFSPYHSTTDGHFSRLPQHTHIFPDTTPTPPPT